MTLRFQGETQRMNVVPFTEQIGNRCGKEYKFSFGHTEFPVVKILEILAQIKFYIGVIRCSHSKLMQRLSIK